MKSYFSRRTEWKPTTDGLMELFQKKRATADPILDLTVSNPTALGLTVSEPDLQDLFAKATFQPYAPDSMGLLRAREAVCSYYADHSISIDPSQVILTAGTSEAYGYLFKLLTEPGDQVLVPVPGYPLLDTVCGLEQIEQVSYPLRRREDGHWQVDFDMLETRISTRTRAIVYIHPNNPTGTYLKSTELAQMNALCERFGLALICDEVFLDYLGAGMPESVQSLASNDAVLTFVLSGLSKILLLPQLKVAWIAVNGPERIRNEALFRLETLADTYLSVATPVQYLLQDLFAFRRPLQSQLSQRIAANEATLRGQLTTVSPIGVRCLPREGGWYLVLELQRDISAQDWVTQLLEQKNVFTHPGNFFSFAEGSRSYVVISCLPERVIFNEAIKRIIDFLV
jgi:aspartate/methionine/tyrosine aminotransferase